MDWHNFSKEKPTKDKDNKAFLVRIDLFGNYQYVFAYWDYSFGDFYIIDFNSLDVRKVEHITHWYEIVFEEEK